MSRPSDIPQDVWDAADGTTNRISSELVKALTGGTEATADGLIQAHVARAIMAERERCAAKADARVISDRLLQALDGYACGASDTARAIADEIRSTP